MHAHATDLSTIRRRQPAAAMLQSTTRRPSAVLSPGELRRIIAEMLG